MKKGVVREEVGVVIDLIWLLVKAGKERRWLGRFLKKIGIQKKLYTSCFAQQELVEGSPNE